MVANLIALYVCMCVSATFLCTSVYIRVCPCVCLSVYFCV